jgi:hypothetical protein
MSCITACCHHSGTVAAVAVGVLMELGVTDWGAPGFPDKSRRVTPRPSDCPQMTYPTKTRRRFTAQQKAEPVELCLQASPATLVRLDCQEEVDPLLRELPKNACCV